MTLSTQPKTAVNKGRSPWPQSLVSGLAREQGKHAHPTRPGLFLRVSPKLLAVFAYRFKDYSGKEVSGKIGEASGPNAISSAEAVEAFDVLFNEKRVAPPPEEPLAATLDRAFNDWLSTRLKRGGEGKPLADRTIQYYGKAYERYLSAKCGSRAVDSITVSDWDTLLEEAKSRSVSQTRGLFWGLHAMYIKRVEHGFLEKNPLAATTLRDKFAVKTKAVRQGRVLAIDIAPFYRNLLALRNRHARDAGQLYLLTGWRRMAVLAMRWDCVDFDARTYTVPDGALGWKAWTGTVPLSLQTIEILVSRKNTVPKAAASAWVFPARHGTFEYMTDVNDSLLKASEPLGYRITAHDLRRTFITLADVVLQGNLRLIGRLIGHRYTDNAEQLQTAITRNYVVDEITALNTTLQTINDTLIELAGVTAPSDNTVALFKARGIAINEPLPIATVDPDLESEN